MKTASAFADVKCYNFGERLKNNEKEGRLCKSLWKACRAFSLFWG